MNHTETAFSDAFHRVGYVPPPTPYDRALAIAVEAWTTLYYDPVARRNYVIDKLKSELTWAVLVKHRQHLVHEIVGALLQEVAMAIEDEKAAVRAPREQVSGTGRLSTDNPKGCARPAQPVAKRSPIDPRESVRAFADVVRMSLLDTFRVNGKAIGDVTALEATAWAGSRERDARFVRLLTANIPQDRLIREFHTAEDVQVLYERAQEAGDGE